MLTKQQRLEVVAITSLKRGRLYRYNLEYIAAIYGVSKSWVAKLMNKAGIYRYGTKGATFRL